MLDEQREVLLPPLMNLLWMLSSSPTATNLYYSLFFDCNVLVLFFSYAGLESFPKLQTVLDVVITKDGSVGQLVY